MMTEPMYPVYCKISRRTIVSAVLRLSGGVSTAVSAKAQPIKVACNRRQARYVIHLIGESAWVYQKW